MRGLKLNRILMIGAACLVAINGRVTTADQLRIFVADYERGLISAIDTSGNVIWDQPFFGASSVAVDSNNVLYATSYENGTIQRFDPVTGAPLAQFASGYVGITGIAFDPSNNVYVNNYNTSELVRFNSSGTQLGVSTSPVGFTDLGIAYNPNNGELVVGGLYTTDLLRFTTGGVAAGSYTTANTYGVEGIAFNSSGDMYVADAYYVDAEYGVIRHYDSSGNYIDDFATFPTAVPLGLAFDPLDNLYVVLDTVEDDFDVSNIGIYAPNGDQLAFLDFGPLGAFGYGITVLMVPEPSSAMLAMGALVGTCGWYRRRKARR